MPFHSQSVVYTIFPPTTVITTFVSKISSGWIENLDYYLDENTYVLSLKYGHRSSRESTRQKIVDTEREEIDLFINENKNRLQLVYAEEKPNLLKIYKFK